MFLMTFLIEFTTSLLVKVIILFGQFAFKTYSLLNVRPTIFSTTTYFVCRVIEKPLFAMVQQIFSNLKNYSMKTY